MKGTIVGRSPDSLCGMAIKHKGKLYRLPESAQGQDPGKRCDFIIVKKYTKPIESTLFLASGMSHYSDRIVLISGLARLV